MNTENIIEQAIWKTKDGYVDISSMTDDHVQKAYNSAEYRFMKYENLAIAAAEKAALFEQKLKQLEHEAKTRHMELTSITIKSKEKFGMLKNRKRLLAID
jgi:hypothetical protein